MYSVCLDDSSDTDDDWDIVDGYTVATPSSASERDPESSANPHSQQDEHDTSDVGSDGEYGTSSQTQPRRKKGGYDSRIEQILYENPELPILVTDAGKSLESGGKYIVYTIRTGVRD